jgi:hypothetical protein
MNIMFYISVIDAQWDSAEFTGMKLAGILTIALGFLIVLIPTNFSNALRLFQR